MWRTFSVTSNLSLQEVTAWIVSCRLKQEWKSNHVNVLPPTTLQKLTSSAIDLANSVRTAMQLASLLELGEQGGAHLYDFPSAPHLSNGILAFTSSFPQSPHLLICKEHSRQGKPTWIIISRVNTLDLIEQKLHQLFHLHSLWFFLPLF